jgi:hypothetical protein
MKIVKSVNNISIRLTDERWFHIVENHDDLAGMAFEVLTAVAEPNFVVQGWRGEFLAVKKLNRKYLVVAYRENKKKKDGFIITAFTTYKIHQIKKRKIIWPQKS